MNDGIGQNDIPLKDAPRNSYKFYQNKDCAYFPCHEVADVNNFNCLFCYCPLYLLADRCGGNFTKLGQIKDCSQCLIPHKAENYDYVVRMLGENMNQLDNSM